MVGMQSYSRQQDNYPIFEDFTFLQYWKKRWLLDLLIYISFSMLENKISQNTSSWILQKLKDKEQTVNQREFCVYCNSQKKENQDEFKILTQNNIKILTQT